MAVLSANGIAPIEDLPYSSISNLASPSGTGLLPIENLLYVPLPNSTQPQGSGTYMISGTVKDAALLSISRKVVAVDRSTNIVYDSVMSNAVTGEFTLYVPNAQCVVYCVPNTGDGVNAEIYDNITPISP